MRLAITGLGCISSAGRGARPLLDRLGQAALTGDAPYATGGLSNPAGGFVRGIDRDRPAELLLASAVRDALAQAGVGTASLVVGTSSGNISGPWERWHQAALSGEPTRAEDLDRAAPTRRLAEAIGASEAVTLSVACASGTAVLAVAAGWIADGAPVVVAAGVDALSLFVHAGFSGLGALCSDVPRPFMADRDGLALGEGAAALVLEPWERATARGATVLAELVGVGLSCDARHMTAPQREGRGVAAAMQAALLDAGLAATAVDTVSIHGTGTRFNDAMEAHALRAVFGEHPLAVHGVKQTIGHTLGAAGAIEAVVAVEALASGVHPRQIIEVDPGLPWPPTAKRGEPPSVVLSTSSAFGGINASALFARSAVARPKARWTVERVAEARVDLPTGADFRKLWPQLPARALRLNAYCRAGLWAVGKAIEGRELPPATGIILATRRGCEDADKEHHERIVREGAARASRLAFTYTVPSAAACEAAIQFGLRGPLLTFIDEPERAVLEATRLIRHGRATCMVALACDVGSAAAVVLRRSDQEPVHA